MAKCTPKTANELYFAIATQVIETANNAIRFYLKRPSARNLNHVEDTLIDLIPFAALTATSELGQELTNQVSELLHNVQSFNTANLLNENEILSYFQTEA